MKKYMLALPKEKYPYTIKFLNTGNKLHIYNETIKNDLESNPEKLDGWWGHVFVRHDYDMVGYYAYIE